MIGSTLLAMACAGAVHCGQAASPALVPKEVILCPIVEVEPVGCLPDSNPAVQLFMTPCLNPDISKVKDVWLHALFRGQSACWRGIPGKNMVRIIAGAQPAVDVPVSVKQAQCIAVRCEPQIPETFHTN